jgi:hypothetical protein
MATTKTTEAIVLQRIERQTVHIDIKGTSPLIVHSWSEKAKNEMREKQTKGTKAKKELKDPAADFEQSMYRLEDGGHGFPATAFKAATIGGARSFEGVTMTQLRPALFFQGEGPQQLVRLHCSDPIMREDMVRVGMGTADLRYRAQYDDWSATLVIIYNPRIITAESIVALVDAGGMGGIGEWRPEKGTGTFGTYEVIA